MDDLLACNVGRLLRSRGETLCVAESCTGGGVGARLTAMPGSSSYFVGGVIAYSNEVKVGHLGVPVGILREDGAVSAACARAMAEGVRTRFRASYGISLTGIAGPGGGSADKPVGLVFVGLSFEGGGEVEKHVFTGGRQAVREQASSAALRLLGDYLEQQGVRDHGK